MRAGGRGCAELGGHTRTGGGRPSQPGEGPISPGRGSSAGRTPRWSAAGLRDLAKSRRLSRFCEVAQPRRAGLARVAAARSSGRSAPTPLDRLISSVPSRPPVRGASGKTQVSVVSLKTSGGAGCLFWWRAGLGFFFLVFYLIPFFNPGAAACLSLRCIFIYLAKPPPTLGSPGRGLPAPGRAGGGCPWPWRAEGLW